MTYGLLFMNKPLVPHKKKPCPCGRLVDNTTCHPISSPPLCVSYVARWSRVFIGPLSTIDDVHSLKHIVIPGIRSQSQDIHPIFVFGTQ